MVFVTLVRALLMPRAALAAENLALRQQLNVLRRSVPRPRVRLRDRLLWVLLRRFWSKWRGSLIIVQPSTVVRWHRESWRLLWRWRSRGKPGQPLVGLEVRELIRRLSRENRLWGAPRIQAELARLGFKVAKSTVERYMSRRTSPPSGKWRALARWTGFSGRTACGTQDCALAKSVSPPLAARNDLERCQEWDAPRT